VADTGELTYHAKLQARIRYGPLRSGAGVSVAEQVQLLLARTDGVLKLTVSADGVYRLTGADLAAAGFDTSGDPARLALYEAGHEVPLRLDDGGDGRLDAGDALEFFGRRNPTTYTDSPQTRYTDANVYWLAWSSRDGRRVPDVDAAPVGLAPAPTFAAVARHEEQALVRRFSFQGERDPGEAGDHWFTAQLIGGGSRASVDCPLTLFGAAPGPAQLRLRVRGATEDAPADPDHALEVLVDGVVVDAFTFDGLAEITRQVDLAGVAWGDRVVTVRVLGDATSRVLVDWVEVGYPRRFLSADGASLRCGLPSAGPVRLENFATSDVAIWDVSDPRSPRRLTGGVVADAGVTVAADGGLSSGAGWQVDLDLTGAAGAAPGRDLLAVASTGVRAPDAQVRHSPTQDLSGGGADYLVLTDASLAAAAQRLADYRAGRGLRARVVTTAEVYDAFSGGVEDPAAIQRFLRYAYERWQQPRLKYVCLLGDGHYDFHGRITAAPNLVPPLMVETEFSWAPCDNRYAAVAGDDLLPDLLIGRLPVDDAAEADALLDKLFAYEADPFDPAWGKRSLFVADDPDIADFPAIQRSLIARLPADHTAVQAFYPEDGTAAEVRQRIVDEASAGNLLVVYTGHGSTTKWADEDLFNAHRWTPGGVENDVDLLTNVGKPSVGLVLNCLSGDFSPTNADLNIMSEAWLRHDRGGAVAFWASTGLTRPAPQERLGRHLFDVLGEGQGVLGDALIEAKLRLAADGGEADDLLDTWTLLGDPAMSLYQEERQLAAPNPVRKRKRGGPRLRLYGCNVGTQAAAWSAWACFLLLLALGGLRAPGGGGAAAGSAAPRGRR
jgi:hypothetical protein